MGDERPFDMTTDRIHTHLDSGSVVQGSAENAQCAINICGAVVVPLMAKPGEIQLP
ncbi:MULTISPECIES: hypothetical protein [Bosea]|uniref:hypothetical protein n=1 Tax=Bosea TaxID=85413 RepID=UPI00274042DE|nr:MULTISPECIES: hypothetical protein [Bosea]